MSYIFRLQTKVCLEKTSGTKQSRLKTSAKLKDVYPGCQTGSRFIVCPHNCRAMSLYMCVYMRALGPKLKSKISTYHNKITHRPEAEPSWTQATSCHRPSVKAAWTKCYKTPNSHWWTAVKNSPNYNLHAFREISFI